MASTSQICLHNLRGLAFAILFLCALPAVADVGGWSFALGCPESGASAPQSSFTADTLSGFSSSGTCRRTESRFTKFSFSSQSGGTLNSSTVYGHHTGDVLIVPPLLNTETKTLYLADAKCPVRNKNLNWLFAQWDPALRTTLNNYPTIGTASYNTSSGITLVSLFDGDGSTLYNGAPIALAGGSCSGGIIALSGAGDRGGSVVFTRNGSGYFKANSGKATLFVPQYTINAAQDLANLTFTGIMANSTSTNAPTVRVTPDASGTVWTVNYYSNPETGTVSLSPTHRVSVSVNTPSNGMMVGTIERYVGGDPTGLVGNISCVMAKGLGTRVQCTGETPTDTTIPFSLVFSIEGPQTLGQSSPKSNHDTETGLNIPSAVSTDGTRLFVADTVNNRVLIWNAIPTSNHTLPDVVLGQPDLASNLANNGPLSNQTLSYPEGVYSDGSRLFVADTGNNRVLIWNSIPTTNQAGANIVLGQPDMNSSDANNGGVSGASLYYPVSVHTNGSRLFVADKYNHRVLIWSSLPTANQTTADTVVGQLYMNANEENMGGELGANTLAFPSAVFSQGSRLFIADGNNNRRVLIFNTIPVTSGSSAEYVVGQPSATSMEANDYGPTQYSFYNPSSVYSNGTNLVVADSDYNRVLIWNTIPTGDYQPANVVLGQPDFDSMSWPAPGSQSFAWPKSVFSDGTKYFVADGNNNRIMLWNSPPSTNQQAANLVLGQPSMTTETLPINAQLVSRPEGIHSDGTRLFVTDATNHRVLIWNSLPKNNQTAADVVLGQPSMTSNSYGGVGTGLLFQPPSVFSDGTRLFVADRVHNRVLIWNSMPTSHQQAADVVLGQPLFSSNTVNNGGISSQSLYDPSSVFSDGTRLVVADSTNHRVLIWNSIPTSNQQAANLVLGQPNMTSRLPNSGGVSAQTLHSPNAVFFDGSKLYVVDTGNNRVLIWNSFPTANQQAANVVVGQANFSSSAANTMYEPTSQSLSYPLGVYSDGTKLFVSDNYNSRVLMWETIPTSNHSAASLAFGQPNLTTGTVNTGGLSGQSLYRPQGIFVAGDRLYVSDTLNKRILTFEIP